MDDPRDNGPTKLNLGRGWGSAEVNLPQLTALARCIYVNYAASIMRYDNREEVSKCIWLRSLPVGQRHYVYPEVAQTA